MPRKGVRIKVSLGFDASGMCLQGAYVVADVEHRGAPDTITVHARSARAAGLLAERKEQAQLERHHRGPYRQCHGSSRVGRMLSPPTIGSRPRPRTNLTATAATLCRSNWKARPQPPTMPP